MDKWQHIARALREAKAVENRYPELWDSGVDEASRRIADALSQVDPSFDRDHFLLSANEDAHSEEYRRLVDEAEYLAQLRQTGPGNA